MSLFVFDLDDTIIVSFMRRGRAGDETPAQRYAKVELLPGRRDALARQLKAGDQVAFATNQGGMAMGYQTIDDVERKMCRVLDVLGFGRPLSYPLSKAPCIRYDTRSGVRLYVAPGHPNARVAGLDTAQHIFMRKPGPGMLLKAMVDYGCAPAQTTFVGDMDSDRDAAYRAGCAFSFAADFFEDGPS